MLWVFPAIVYGISIAAVIFEIFPISCLILIATIPFIIKSGHKLKFGYEQLNKQVNTNL